MATTPKILVLLLGTALAASAFTPPPFSSCDINQDAVMNILDIQVMIQEALNVTTPVHDLNGDGVVDAVDVQIVAFAALGRGCLAGPQAHTIGSAPLSVENSASPLVPGPMTLAINSSPFSLENSASPLAVGPQTLVLNGLPFSIENSASPLATGPQTFALNGLPFSVLNTVSPFPTSPQTYAIPGLEFSIFNGPNPPALTAGLLTPSLRFLVPVEPAFVRQALLRGAQSVNGKAGCQDSDGDGLCDADELIIGTNPLSVDTDGDGYPDGLELSLGSDPLDPKSMPNISPGGYFATSPVSVQIISPVAIVTARKQGAINADYR